MTRDGTQNKTMDRATYDGPSMEGSRTGGATPSPPQSRTSHVIVEYSDGCAKGRTEKLMPAAERSEAKGLLPEAERSEGRIGKPAKHKSRFPTNQPLFATILISG